MVPVALAMVGTGVRPASHTFLGATGSIANDGRLNGDQGPSKVEDGRVPCDFEAAAHSMGKSGPESRDKRDWHHKSRCLNDRKGVPMAELLVDFITSLDGYASGEGWPGFWGLEGPEYLAWLEEQPEVTYLMGANTYRLMSGFSAGQTPAGTDEFTEDEQDSIDGLTRATKIVFSTTLEEPLAWANTTVVRGDAVETVRTMKADDAGILSTIGSLSVARALLQAGLVDRFRVGMFPVITGATGAERIYDGYPDVALDMIGSHTFDDRIQVVEYRPRVLERPPLAANR